MMAVAADLSAWALGDSSFLLTIQVMNQTFTCGTFHLFSRFFHNRYVQGWNKPELTINGVCTHEWELTKSNTFDMKSDNYMVIFFIVLWVNSRTKLVN